GKARARVGPKTRAIIPVHLYGHPSAMDEFLEISLETGLKLVEDACQAHGAEFGSKRVGSIGEAGCFSFYPAKNMTVGGDGGMITRNNEELGEAGREAGLSPIRNPDENERAGEEASGEEWNRDGGTLPCADPPSDTVQAGVWLHGGSLPAERIALERGAEPADVSNTAGR